MTNRRLFQQVTPILNVLGEGGNYEHFGGAQTTPVRYAVVKNQQRLNDALEGYREVLKEIAEEADVAQEDIQETVNALINGTATTAAKKDALPTPQHTTEKIEDLLDQDTDFDPYTVAEEAVMEEPNIPIEVLAGMDFMIGEKA